MDTSALLKDVPFELRDKLLRVIYTGWLFIDLASVRTVQFVIYRIILLIIVCLGWIATTCCC